MCALTEKRVLISISQLHWIPQVLWKGYSEGKKEEQKGKKNQEDKQKEFEVEQDLTAISGICLRNCGNLLKL